MNHVLLAFALLAAGCLYPAGLSLAAAGAAAAGGGWVAAHPHRSAPLPTPAGAGTAFGAAALLVLPLPLSGNPLFQLQSLGVATTQIGGVALSLLGLFLLRPTRGRGGRQVVSVGAGVVFAILLIAFAIALRSPGWLSLVEAGGGGAEAGRIALGLAGLVLIAVWVDPGNPAVGERLRFAALAAVSLILLVPVLARGPVWLTLVVWVGSAGLGSICHQPLARLVAKLRTVLPTRSR